MEDRKKQQIEELAEIRRQYEQAKEAEHWRKLREQLEQDKLETQYIGGFVEGDYPEPFPTGGYVKGDFTPQDWESLVPKVFIPRPNDPPNGWQVVIETYPARSESPKTWLEQTKEVTEQQRQRNYGSPLLNFLRIAVQWTMWLQGRKGVPFIITPIDVAWMMNGLKLSRETHTHQDDNGIDTMGYLACHDAIDRHMKSLGYDDGAEAFREMTFAEMVELMEELTLDE